MALGELAVAGATGYVLGTIPSADLVARRARRGPVDLRHEGSGNPGAANATRVLGRRAGAVVAVADVSKGILAASFGAVVAGPAGAQVGACSAVVGHCFPVWNRFRGGKGVAAAVGQCLATVPAAFPLSVGVALGTARLSGSRPGAAPATVAATATWVLTALAWWAWQLPTPWGPRPSVALPVGTVVSAAIVLGRFATARPPVGMPADIGTGS